MGIAASPLRYPGGKSCLKPLIVEFLKLNKMQLMPYAEPYAGGCGLALELLFGGFVSKIHINDIDRSIWSFWHSVLSNTDDLIDLIESTPVTMEEWHKQRNILANPDRYSSTQLGFSAFFLNRTNRSGIIKGAGVIGGNAQTGNYKIDCRFNKPTLIKRIKRVSKYKNRIHLYNLDASVFLMEVAGKFADRTFICIDPPYFNKGASLYTSFYKKDDHKAVSTIIKKLNHPWVVTYDDTNEVRQIYDEQRLYEFSINYSVQTKRIGTELLIASNRLKVPQRLGDPVVRFSHRDAA